MSLEDEPPLRWWGILLIVLGCCILLLVIIILIIIIYRYCKSGRVFPYDEETVVTRKTKRKKSGGKRKVIQTQTSPSRSPAAKKRSDTPTGALLSERRTTHTTTHTTTHSQGAPAVLITDATPQPSPRDVSPEQSSLPGTVDDDKPWASPYPDPTPSESEPQSSRKKPVTVERVSGAVTPSNVDVSASSVSSPAKQPKKGNIFEMLPDVGDGKNIRPGRKFTNRVGVDPGR